jgi:uncharacterized protein (DUF3084 family)
MNEIFGAIVIGLAVAAILAGTKTSWRKRTRIAEALSSVILRPKRLKGWAEHRRLKKEVEAELTRARASGQALPVRKSDGHPTEVLYSDGMISYYFNDDLPAYKRALQGGSLSASENVP